MDLLTLILVALSGAVLSDLETEEEPPGPGPLALPLGTASHQFLYWASCPELTAEIIHYITDPVRARDITYQTFAARTDLAPLREGDHPAMYRISAPDNWAISFHRSTLPSGRPIYYFDWSRIEHIFIDPERGTPDIDEETQRARAAGY